MLQAIQTAGAGLRQQQTRMDVIADNLANINTVGFKGSRVDFKDALYINAENPADAGSQENLRKGTGVLLGASSRGFEGGALTQTGRTLDFAIEGQGFFTLDLGGGVIAYTRNGAFELSAEDGASWLVDSGGAYVLDRNGQRIAVDTGLENISVTDSGELRLGSRTAALAIADFPNREGLESLGGSAFYATEASGGAADAEDFKLSQGVLEASNVDLAQEMVLLMRTQRALSFAGRALQTADEMDGLANRMRG